MLTQSQDPRSAIGFASIPVPENLAPNSLPAIKELLLETRKNVEDMSERAMQLYGRLGATPYREVNEEADPIPCGLMEETRAAVVSLAKEIKKLDTAMRELQKTIMGVGF